MRDKLYASNCKKYHSIFPHKVYIFLIKINSSLQWKNVRMEVGFERNTNVAQSYNSVQLQFRFNYTKYNSTNTTTKKRKTHTMNMRYDMILLMSLILNKNIESWNVCTIYIGTFPQEAAIMLHFLPKEPRKTVYIVLSVHLKNIFSWTHIPCFVYTLFCKLVPCE